MFNISSYFAIKTKMYAVIQLHYLYSEEILFYNSILFLFAILGMMEWSENFLTLVLSL
jgi:hypothetical protein